MRIRRLAGVNESIMEMCCFYKEGSLTTRHAAESCNRALVFAALLLIVCCASCGHADRKAEASGKAEPAEVYHADNDIAMVVRSVADAMRVGEPLDSADYAFEGVLTDGQGTPLYTDVQGSPGRWETDVLSPTSVVIRNMYLGDLLPDNLRSYLAGALGVDESAPVASDDLADDAETEIDVYDFGGGTICFETRIVTAPNGIDGTLMTIRMSK